MLRASILGFAALASLASGTAAAEHSVVLSRELGGMSQREAGTPSGLARFMANRDAVVGPHFGRFVALAKRLLAKEPRTLRDPNRAEADALFSKLRAARLGNVPDDFCFARAEVAARAVQREGYEVRKINVIAPSGTKLSSHLPSGVVTWAYHVAPLVRVGRTDYVLDPLLADHKLEVPQWKALLHNRRGETIITDAEQMVFETPISKTDAERTRNLAISLAQVAGLRHYELLRTAVTR